MKKDLLFSNWKMAIGPYISSLQEDDRKLAEAAAEMLALLREVYAGAFVAGKGADLYHKIKDFLPRFQVEVEEEKTASNIADLIQKQQRLEPDVQKVIKDNFPDMHEPFDKPLTFDEKFKVGYKITHMPTSPSYITILCDNYLGDMDNFIGEVGPKIFCYPKSYDWQIYKEPEPEYIPLDYESVRPFLFMHISDGSPDVYSIKSANERSVFLSYLNNLTLMSRISYKEVTYKNLMDYVTSDGQYLRREKACK